MINDNQISDKRWLLINDSDRSLLKKVLENRDVDISRLSKFSDFTDKRLSEDTNPPESLRDISKASQRILKALKRDERICIYGDYDADGVCSTALAYNFFQEIGHKNVFAILPHREKDGYGLSKRGVKEAHEKEASLIITVDNGISENEAISLANEKGLDVVVTDHHLQKRELPEAVAVVDPKRDNSNYPFPGLAGVGVFYKIIQNLLPEIFDRREKIKGYLYSILDLVAIGTVADLCPMKDENRVFVKEGLKVLNNTENKGLKELIKVSDHNNQEIDSYTISFALAPRINAQGRMEHPYKAFKLLTTDSEGRAQKIAKKLNKINSQRRRLQRKFVKQALEINEELHDRKDKIIILKHPDWTKGTIGLIASRLTEKYHKPSIILTDGETGEEYVASCRSIEDFHITDAIGEFEHLLEEYGGHRQAAGFSIVSENLSKFKDKFMDFANENIPQHALHPTVKIDSFISVDNMNFTTTQALKKLRPYGVGFPKPVFALKDCKIVGFRKLSGGKHLKILISKEQQNFQALWWNAGDMLEKLKSTHKIDVVFRLEENVWKGQKNLQLVVKDIKASRKNNITKGEGVT